MGFTKNEFTDTGEYLVVHCSKDKDVLIDYCDSWVLDEYRMCVHKTSAFLVRSGASTSLIRAMFPDKVGSHVLHINKDSLDYRRYNLYTGNSYREENGYIVGTCSNGEEFKIDADDYDLIKTYTWHVDKNDYLITKRDGKIIKMHRLIMGIHGKDPKIEVDHIHHDTHDNRKSELRITDRSGNCFNRRILKSNKSGYTGVYWMESAKKWAAQLRIRKQTYYLGVYDTPEQAYEARKKAEAELL